MHKMWKTCRLYAGFAKDSLRKKHRTNSPPADPQRENGAARH